MSIPREGSRDTGRGIIVSIYPDVCFAKKDPVPFSVYAIQGEDANTAATVRMTGQRAHNAASLLTCCHGDEPGVAGVKSGTVGSVCRPKTWSSTVRIEGKPAVRHGDEWWMNNGNTVGKLSWVEDTKIEEPTPPLQEAPGKSHREEPQVVSDASPAAEFWKPGAQVSFLDANGTYTKTAPSSPATAPSLSSSGGAPPVVKPPPQPPPSNRWWAHSILSLARRGGGLTGPGAMEGMARLDHWLKRHVNDPVDWVSKGPLKTQPVGSANLDAPRSEIPGLMPEEERLAPPDAQVTSETLRVTRKKQEEKEPDPCEIGPYSKMKRLCGARGGQAHHIVPDFTLRTGPRPRTVADDTTRINGAPGLNDGMSICLSGHAKVKDGEHFAAHDITDLAIARAGAANIALPGTATWQQIKTASLDGIQAAKPDCLDAADAAVSTQFADMPPDQLLRAVMDHRQLPVPTKESLLSGNRLAGGQIVSP